MAEYLEFQQFNRSFAEVGAFRTGEANLMAGERALRVRSAIVDSHLLNALGVQPAQGRLFTSEDSVVSAPALPGGAPITAPVALISDELWRSAFGAQPIVGRSVDVDGRRLLVVGVHGARRRSRWTTTRRSGCRSVSRTPNARRATTTTSRSSDG